jgi:hypothetical protein
MALPQLRLLGTLKVFRTASEEFKIFIPATVAVVRTRAWPGSSPPGLDLSPECNMTSSELHR